LVLLTAFYGTTVYYYTNPGLAEYQRFLTFHIGVESSAELISLGLTGMLLTKLAGIERTEVAFIIFGTICVAVLAMLTASAGYLIWPGNWLVAALAGIGFSMLHLLSAAAFFVLLIKAIQNGLVKKSDYRFTDSGSKQLVVSYYRSGPVRLVFGVPCHASIYKGNVYCVGSFSSCPVWRFWVSRLIGSCLSLIGVRPIE